MISAAKIAANRRNAQKSTGPRSSAGKARVGRNAFRHGLAVPISRDVFNADVVEPLARELAGKSAGLAEQEHAQLTAEAQAEILRVRRAKADLLNRAARRLRVADPDPRSHNEIMAQAFVTQLDTLSAFDHYERRARSRRKRALWALMAARRAREDRQRTFNIFVEPVETLDVMAVMRGALAHASDARNSEPVSGPVHGTTLNLHADGLVRADAFIRRHDAASGRMDLHLTYDGRKTLEQTFTIVKSSTGVGGGRWTAICPITGKAVTKLYMRAGESMVKSRHAMNLHYRLNRHGADQRQRGKRRPEEEPSETGVMANYVAIVAAILGPTPPDKSTKTDPILERGGTMAADGPNDGPQPMNEHETARPESGPTPETSESVHADQQSSQPAHHHKQDSSIPEAGIVPSQPDPRDQQSGETSISMAATPTLPSDPSRTADGEVVPPSINPGDVSSVSPEENDLEAGDRFAAEDKPDEALAAYRRHIALCQAKIEEGSSLRAFDELDLAPSRIGHLAAPFLLAGKFEQALNCADEGLKRIPNWPNLEIARAHALMFLGSEEQARSIYLRYRHVKVSPKKTYARIIRENFADLRRVGQSHPLMDEIERKFTRAKPTKPAPPKVTELAEAQPPPQPIAVTPPPLAEIVLGDKLMSRGKIDKALAVYRRGITACKVAIAKDETDVRAGDDFDLLVSRIGSLAFRLLQARRPVDALGVIEEVISHRPDWVSPRMIYAHALMFGPNKTATLAAYRNYSSRTLETGESWGAAIRSHFAALRAAGVRHPFMKAIEHEFPLKE